jgi:hypothetical protein
LGGAGGLDFPDGGRDKIVERISTIRLFLPPFLNLNCRDIMLPPKIGNGGCSEPVRTKPKRKKVNGGVLISYILGSIEIRFPASKKGLRNPFLCAYCCVYFKFILFSSYHPPGSLTAANLRAVRQSINPTSVQQNHRAHAENFGVFFGGERVLLFFHGANSL